MTDAYGRVGIKSVVSGATEFKSSINKIRDSIIKLRGAMVSAAKTSASLSKQLNQLEDSYERLGAKSVFTTAVGPSVSKAFDDIKSSASGAKQEIKALTQEFGQSTTTVRALKTSIPGLAKGYIGFASSIKNVTDKLISYRRQLQLTEKQSSAFGRSLKEIAAMAMMPINAIFNLGQSISSIGWQLNWVGRDLFSFGMNLTAALTTPFLLASGASVKAFAEFEEGLTKIQTLVGLSQESTEAWGEAILELSPKLGQTPSELLASLYEITSAGFGVTETATDMAQAMDILELSVKGASIGMGEARNIADLLTSVVAAYSKEGVTAAHASDVLLGAIRAGKFEAQDMVLQMGRAVGLASTMGISFEELSAFLATYSRVGVSAQVATSAFVSAMTSFLRPTNQAKEALEKYGITIEDVRTAIADPSIGLSRVLLTLGTIFAEDSESLSRLVGQSRGLASVLVLTGGLAEDYGEVLGQVTNSQGILENSFDKLADDLSFKWKIIKAEAFVTAITFAKTVAPAIKTVADNVIVLLSKLNQFIKDNPKLVKSIAILGAMIAAIGPMMLILGGIISSVGSLIHSFGTSIKLVASLGKMLAGLSSIIMSLVLSPLSLLATGLNVVNKVVGTVGYALGYLAGTVLTPVLSILKRTGDTIKGLFTVMRLTSPRLLLAPFVFLAEGIKKPLSFVASSITTAFSLLTNPAGGIMAAIKSLLSSVVVGVAGIGKATVTALLFVPRTLIKIFSPANIISALSSLTKLIPTLLIGAVKLATKGVGVAILGLGKAFLSLPLIISNMVSGTVLVVTSLVGTIASILGALVPILTVGLIAGLGALAALFAITWSDIKANMGDSFNAFAADAKSWGQNIGIQLGNGIINAAIYVVKALTYLGQIISNWLKPGSPPKLLPDLDDWGTEAAQVWLDGWTSADFTVFNEIASQVESYVRNVNNMLESMGDSNATSNIAETIFSIRQVIQEAIDNLISKTTFDSITIGGSISFEAISQIEQAIDKIREAVGHSNIALEEYVRSMLQLEVVSRAVSDAQAHLAETEKMFDDALSPLQKRLDEISKARRDFENDMEREALQEILDDAFATPEAKELAKLALEELDIQEQIALLEEQKEVAVSAAEEELQIAEDALDIAQEQFDLSKAQLENQIEYNRLLEERNRLNKEENDRLDDLAGAGGSSGGGGGGGGDGELPDLGGFGGFTGGGVTDEIQGIWDSVTQGADKFLSDVLDPFQGKIGELKEALSGFAKAWASVFEKRDEIVKVFDAFDRFKETVLAIVGTTIESIFSTIADVFGLDEDDLPDLEEWLNFDFPDSAEEMIAFLDKLTIDMSKAFPDSLQKIITATRNFSESIKDIWTKIADWIKEKLDLVDNQATKLTDKSLAFSKQNESAVTGILENIGLVAGAIIKTLEEAIALKVWVDFGYKFEQLQQTVGMFSDNFGRIWASTWSIAETLFNSAMTNIDATIELVMSLVTGDVEKAAEKMENAIRTFQKNTVKLFQDLLEILLEIVIGMIEVFTGQEWEETGKDIMEAVGEGIKMFGLVPVIQAVLDEAKRVVQEWIDSVLRSATNAIMGGEFDSGSKSGGGKSGGDAPQTGGGFDEPIPALASGTTSYRGGVAMVGEAGRELVRLPKGSRIFSNYQTEQMIMSAMRAPTPVTPSVQFGDIYIKDSLDVEQFKSIVTQTVRGMLK